MGTYKDSSVLFEIRFFQGDARGASAVTTGRGIHLPPGLSAGCRPAVSRSSAQLRSASGPYAFARSFPFSILTTRMHRSASRRRRASFWTVVSAFFRADGHMRCVCNHQYYHLATDLGRISLMIYLMPPAPIFPCVACCGTYTCMSPCWAHLAGCVGWVFIWKEENEDLFILFNKSRVYTISHRSV